MIPRADIEAVEIGITLGELLTVFEQSGHSRMPVFAETLDDPRGMVHIRDVLAHITKLARARKSRARKAASSALSSRRLEPFYCLNKPASRSKKDGRSTVGSTASAGGLD